MFSFLPAPILLVLNLLGIAFITLVLALPMLVLVLIRFILPKQVAKVIDKINQGIFRIWCEFIAGLIHLTNKVEWHIPKEIPTIKGSCILICNHISWTDIVILLYIFRGKIPITKFFLKKSLIYIPIIGLVCYALGMPFLNRYSRQQLLKNPKLLQKDIQSTKKACQLLLETPSTLVNFLEGTRYTKEKAKLQNSPYKNLMPPKVASLGVSLGLIGRKVDCILNTTLLYPDNTGNIFIQMLQGRLHTIIATVERIEITDDLIGDYLKDKKYKADFTNKMKDLWSQKDQHITNLLDNLNRQRLAQQSQEKENNTKIETVGDTELNSKQK